MKCIIKVFNAAETETFFVCGCWCNRHGTVIALEMPDVEIKLAAPSDHTNCELPYYTQRFHQKLIDLYHKLIVV